MKNKNGFTLIELQIGLVLSSILMLLALTGMQMVNQFYLTATEKIELIETMDFSHYLFRKNLKGVGEYGCPNETYGKKLETHPLWPKYFSSSPKILSKNAAISQHLNLKTHLNHMDNHNSILYLPGLHSETINILKFAKLKNQFILQSQLTLKSGMRLLLKNCESVNLVTLNQVKNLGEAKFLVKILEEEEYSLMPGMQFHALEFSAWYLADTGRVDKQGNKINGLYIRNISPESHTSPQALLEGIHDWALKIQDKHLKITLTHLFQHIGKQVWHSIYQKPVGLSSSSY